MRYLLRFELNQATMKTFSPILTTSLKFFFTAALKRLTKNAAPVIIAETTRPTVTGSVVKLSIVAPHVFEIELQLAT
jgi:hypothetical protein